LNNIKTEFTIKDLENFSGIKAHTIRIWEKRYNILQPKRSISNIRYYDINNLQKLLNVSLLNSSGFKISKISQLSEDSINVKVRELVQNESANSQASNSLKLAMLGFDDFLFNKTYNSLISQFSFRYIFKSVFIPFLNEMGILWQVNTITPAHEHFISNLINQKIHVNIDKLQVSDTVKKAKPFVLFLPLNEIHELGLLFLHYELLLHGYNSIYLGQSVPLGSLNALQKVYPNANFITYLTVEPSKEPIEEYLKRIEQEVVANGDCSVWVLGGKVKNIIQQGGVDFKGVRLFNSNDELLELI
jgi:DNA-binding transcriptional MerR regulator